MRTHDALQMVVVTAVCGIWYYFTFQVEDSFRSIKVDDVLPLVIGFHVVKLVLEIFHVPTFPGLSTWLASIQIYIGTALDVMVCYVSLIRINYSYLWLAMFPLIAISFICVLCMRHNSMSSRGDVKSGSSLTGSSDNSKKTTVISEKFNILVLLNNGSKTRVICEEFNISVLQLAPHLILCVSGMVGDPDHDGNNYNISNLFLFFTCMLQDLTLIMTKLSTTISRGIAPASELLYKASLVVLLLTAHILVVNGFGNKVVLLLLPEVAPLLLWFSLHLDRRTPIIDVQNIVGTEHFVLRALVVAICGYIAVPKNEYLFFRLCWTSMSCFTSGLMTYIMVLVLRLWPDKVGMDTLSSEEVLELLMFWCKLLLNAAAWLLAFGVVVWLNR